MSGLIMKVPAPPDSMNAVMEFCLRWLDDWEAESFLDVGCGPGTYLNLIRANRPEVYAYAVDAHAPSLLKVAAARKWCGVLPGVLNEIGPKSIDMLMCLDVIEHLDKPTSIQMIDAMEEIACKGVLLFTPSGFMPQAATKENPFQEHKCGFEDQELADLGYDVVVWKDFNYGAYPGTTELRFRDALWAWKSL